MTESHPVIDQNIGLFSRQAGIIKPEELEKHVVIVGAGGIGSWTALSLAKMGINKITIVDFDDIEDVNIAPQIYGMADIGKKKCQVLADFINANMQKEIATAIDTKWEDWKERETYFEENDVEILIMAVDSMDVRLKIWGDIKYAGLGLVLDGRMMKELLSVYACRPAVEEDVKFYQENLYPSADVDPTPCTERAVAYNQFVMAGLMGTLVKHFAKGELETKKIFVDLYSFIMDVQ